MIARCLRTSEALAALIVAETRRHPGGEAFTAEFAIVPVRREPGDFSYRTWEPSGVTLPVAALPAFRAAVENIRRRYDLWPWNDPREEDEWRSSKP